jgi:DNA-binding transcriptional regulator YiaG
VDIKALRKTMQMTQKSFSDLIGVSLTTLWRLEKGHEKPSKTLVKLLGFITQKK